MADSDAQPRLLILSGEARETRRACLAVEHQRPDVFGVGDALREDLGEKRLEEPRGGEVHERRGEGEDDGKAKHRRVRKRLSEDVDQVAPDCG